MYEPEIKCKYKDIWFAIQEQAFIAGTEALCEGESFDPKDVEEFVESVDKLLSL